MKKFIMEKQVFQQCTNEINQFGDKIFTIPNILSLFRLFLIPIIVWLYYFEANYLVAGIILAVSGLTDVIDGFIARKFNMISKLGKILDPIADKATQTSVMVCLALRFPLILIPLILLIIKELFMGISGLIVIKKTNQVMSSSWHGKVATITLYLMMGLHIFWYDVTKTVSIISIIVSTGMIILSFILYAIHNITKIILSKTK